MKTAIKRERNHACMNSTERKQAICETSMVLRNIGLMLIVLLLTACSSESDTTETKQPSVINVYVFAPDKPIITRGDIGDVSPIDNTINESKITKLQIWVFDHTTSALVSYYSPESVDNLNGTNNNGEAHYQLSVSEAFAQAAQTAQANNSPKPHVDVYVVANTASCGIPSLGESTTRTELEALMIQKDYFGLTTLTDEVPEAGLPMSGVLRNVEIQGSSPVYRLENVKLTRAVSKIRFVFCRETPEEGQEDIPVKIKSVNLNASMIPTSEYLFLETDENAMPYRVGSFETNDAKPFLPAPWDDIPKNDDPLKYVYQSQTAQDYEDLIAEGLNKTVTVEGQEVSAPELKQLGPYYLRESDKLLQGVITYQKGEEAEKTATFEMKTVGDFSRNHTWTVYAYYSKSGLVAVTVAVKNWDNYDRSHEVYNW